jgi:protein required for attachment to host cells
MEENTMQKTVLWILLADGGNARIIEREGPFGNLTEIHSLTHSHMANRDLGNDRAGRGFESSGTTRHAYEPRTDWHEQQKDDFAKDIVRLLNDAHMNQKFHELYILAPAKMLGLIRQHLTHVNNEMSSKVSKELSKDAIAFTLPEIKKYIETL